MRIGSADFRLSGPCPHHSYLVARASSKRGTLRPRAWDEMMEVRDVYSSSGQGTNSNT
jgi:hypothetical protein